MTKLLKNAGIYILTNRVNGKCYVSKDKKLGSRAEQHLSLKSPSCPAIHNAIKKYGRNAFDVQLIPYPNISDKALCEVERWKIRQFGSHRSEGGLNLTGGGDGFDSKTARETNLKRVAEGTHPFLGGDIQRKRVAEGTHNFLDPQFHRKRAYTQKIRAKNRRREFYRRVSVILTAKSVCEERLYRKRIREGFFDKEIPDMSKSEQLDLFEKAA